MERRNNNYRRERSRNNEKAHNFQPKNTDKRSKNPHNPRIQSPERTPKHIPSFTVLRGNNRHLV